MYIVGAHSLRKWRLRKVWFHDVHGGLMARVYGLPAIYEIWQETYIWMLLDHLKMNEGFCWWCFFFFLPINQASPETTETPLRKSFLPGVSVRWKKKRHHAATVVTKQLRWKPSRSWRTARGRNQQLETKWRWDGGRSHIGKIRKM